MLTLFLLVAALFGAGHAEDAGCQPVQEILVGHTLLLKAARSIGLPPNPGTGPFTMLAPTDEAIQAFLDSVGMSLEDMVDQPEVLKGIRDYHSLLEPLRMKDFEDGKVYPTGMKKSPCGNAELVAEVTGDENVIMKSPISQATIVKKDEISCEGIVVHTVDAVLVPCRLPKDKPSY